MAEGMSRMIQMLAALSDMQQRRRAQDLAERQFSESQAQFAAQMGFNEKSAEYKKVADFLDAIARSSVESRNALVGLGKAVGLKDDQVQWLAAYGASAPEAMQVIQSRAAGQGYRDATPDQRAGMNREAAYAATTGMNQGQAAASVLQSMLAGGGNPVSAYGVDMLNNAAAGFLERLATGRTPEQAAMGNRFASQPDLVNQAARGMAGYATPYQTQQLGQQAQTISNQSRGLDLQAEGLDIQRGQLEADMRRIAQQGIEAAAKIASKNAMGGLEPSDYINAVTEIRNLTIAGGKEKSESNRNTLAAIRNKLIQAIGFDPETPEGQRIMQQRIQTPSYMQRMNPFPQGLPFDNRMAPWSMQSPWAPQAPFMQTPPIPQFQIPPYRP